MNIHIEVVGYIWTLFFPQIAQFLFVQVTCNNIYQLFNRPTIKLEHNAWN